MTGELLPFSADSLSTPSTTSASASAATVTTDVMGTEDIVIGIILALALSFTASFLQGRRTQTDFVLWEKKQQQEEDLLEGSNETTSKGCLLYTSPSPRD